MISEAIAASIGVSQKPHFVTNTPSDSTISQFLLVSFQKSWTFFSHWIIHCLGRFLIFGSVEWSRTVYPSTHDTQIQKIINKKYLHTMKYKNVGCHIGRNIISHWCHYQTATTLSEPTYSYCLDRRPFAAFISSRQHPPSEDIKATKSTQTTTRSESLQVMVWYRDCGVTKCDWKIYIRCCIYNIETCSSKVHRWWLKQQQATTQQYVDTDDSHIVWIRRTMGTFTNYNTIRNMEDANTNLQLPAAWLLQFYWNYWY